MNRYQLWALLGLFATITAAPVLGAGYLSGVTDAEHGAAVAERAGGIQQLLLPGSRVPKIGTSDTEAEYVRWAETALSRGQDAEAEVSLEWAVLRHRVNAMEAALEAGRPPPADDDFCVKPLCQALHAIGDGNIVAGMDAIHAARHDLAQGQQYRTQTATR